MAKHVYRPGACFLRNACPHLVRARTACLHKLCDCATSVIKCMNEERRGVTYVRKHVYIHTHIHVRLFFRVRVPATCLRELLAVIVFAGGVPGR